MKTEFRCSYCNKMALKGRFLKVDADLSVKLCISCLAAFKENKRLKEAYVGYLHDVKVQMLLVSRSKDD